MLFLKQPLICLFSAINQEPLVRLTHTRSRIESTAPPQQPLKRITISWDTLSFVQLADGIFSFANSKEGRQR